MYLRQGNIWYTLVDNPNIRKSTLTTYCIYRQTRNISHTSEGNKIINRSEVVGASPVGAAATNLHSRLNTWLLYIAQSQLQDNMRNI